MHNTIGNTQYLEMQPPTGGPPVKLTHFDSESAQVKAYGWSGDGKKSAITRARYNDSDVVMFIGIHFPHPDVAAADQSRFRLIFGCCLHLILLSLAPYRLDRPKQAQSE